MGKKKQVEEMIAVSDTTGFWVSEARIALTDMHELSSNRSGVEYFISLQSRIADQFNVAYQVFKPGQIISIDHISMIVRHVESAFLKDTNISNSPSFEFLLYLARVRQIKRAITQVGADLDDPKETSLKFCEILFGSPAAVKKAKTQLDELTKLYIRTEMNFVPLNSLGAFLAKNNFSVGQLKNFIHTEDIYEIPEKDGLDHILQLPEPLIRKAVVDCLAGDMLTLFLENYRKTKGRSN